MELTAGRLYYNIHFVRTNKHAKHCFPMAKKRLLLLNLYLNIKDYFYPSTKRFYFLKDKHTIMYLQLCGKRLPKCRFVLASSVSRQD